MGSDVLERAPLWGSSIDVAAMLGEGTVKERAWEDSGYENEVLECDNKCGIWLVVSQPSENDLLCAF